MKVIVGGCGRVGVLVASRLGLDGHEVAVIDQDPDAFRLLGAGFGGTTHTGKIFDRRTLIEAGVERADAFVAVTSGDNSNVVSSLVAKDEFGVPRVIARIYDPRRADIYRRLGISAVSSVMWAANEIRALLGHPGLAEEKTFGDAEVRLVSVVVPPRLEGRTVRDLERIGEVVVAAVVRSGAAWVPTGREELRHGDELHVAVAASAFEHFEGVVAP